MVFKREQCCKNVLFVKHIIIEFPLESGIGSNLVGIQTSRLSTFLHQTAPKGKLPKSNPTPYIQPFAAFIGSGKILLENINVMHEK